VRDSIAAKLDLQRRIPLASGTVVFSGIGFCPDFHRLFCKGGYRGSVMKNTVLTINTALKCKIFLSFLIARQKISVSAGNNMF
jgi:hypothetical protein